MIDREVEQAMENPSEAFKRLSKGLDEVEDYLAKLPKLAKQANEFTFTSPEGTRICISREQAERRYGVHLQEIAELKRQLKEAAAERDQALDKLDQQRAADKFDAPYDETLRRLIPAKYLGWSLKGAAADYIDKLKCQIARYTE